jgi:hypothetical protein
MTSVVRGVAGMDFFAASGHKRCARAMNDKMNGGLEGRIVACDLIKYVALFLILPPFIICCSQYGKYRDYD